MQEMKNSFISFPLRQSLCHAFNIYCNRLISKKMDLYIVL